MAPRRTPTKPPRIRAALAMAHKKMTGKAAAPELLDVLTAHVSHETGNGEKMYNFNFGGIKGAGPSGWTARLRTTEYFGGRRTRIRDGFRAYRSLEDGAADYLAFLQGRYATAFEKARHGDVDGFTAALKKRGYFTAPIEDYANAMRTHMGEAAIHRAASLDEQIGEGGRYLYGVELASESRELEGTVGAMLPTTVQVARVMDAMSSMALRISRPVEDPEELKG